jgi:uncharacterized membrane protein (GlpM family)
MPSTSAALLVAKVALVAVVVLLASLVSRRFGHVAGGLLAGMPMIAAPITGLLLTEVPPERVRSVCLATLVCQPALIAYLVSYAHAASRWRWPLCLLLSLAVFALLGAALLQLSLPPWASMALAVAAPLVGWRLMPARTGAPATAAAAPRTELAARVAVAMAVASGVLWGAGHLSAGVAGLLLAAPITGIVLPSFTLPRHGAQATAALLAGFIRGQAGFVAFFVMMVLALPHLPGGLAWGLALALSALVPWGLGRLRR